MHLAFWGQPGKSRLAVLIPVCFLDLAALQWWKCVSTPAWTWESLFKSLFSLALLLGLPHIRQQEQSAHLPAESPGNSALLSGLHLPWGVEV